MVALLLACIGLYGVLNYTVVRQRREIGVRMALGASASQLVSRLARDTVVLVASGAAIGLAGGSALAASSNVSCSKSKPWIPSRCSHRSRCCASPLFSQLFRRSLRAVRINPAETLRSE